MAEYVEQHLHGDYFKNVGDYVQAGEAIGYVNGHGAGVELAPHDHTSVAKWNGNEHKHGGWFNGYPNDLINPATVANITGNPNDKFVFDPANGLGGYGYLQQTPYNWYTGPNKSLHDGIDLWGLKGQFVYALNSGYITDVGRQSNGLTYIYIK